MKKSINFLRIASILILSTQMTGASMDHKFKYSGIFDEGIYNMKPRFLRMEGDKKIYESPLKALERGKNLQLQKKYLTVLEQKIKSYESTICKERGPGFDGGVQRVFDDARRSVGSGIMSGFYEAFDGIHSLFTTKGRDERHFSQRLGRFSKIDNPQLEFEITKIKSEINEKMISLQFETVLDLENKYVQVKKDLDLSLRTQIERSLILYRECDGILLEIERRFVNEALSLPREVKPLLPESQDFYQKIKEAFHSYTPSVRRAVQKVVQDIVYNSEVEGESSFPTRSVRYFYGPPGGGKTTSILKIADILDLPIHHMTIKGPSDLNPIRLEGGDRLSPDNRNLGWFISPLVGNKGKPSYKNAILLIDDIDLEMNADEVLSSLKYYLDPISKFFSSPYFGCDIYVGHMNIFVTSNQKIPQEEKYKALRSRVEEVYFPADYAKEEYSVFIEYLDKCFRGKDIPLDDIQRKKVVDLAKFKVEQKGEDPDFRNIQREINDISLEVLIDKMEEETFDIDISLERIKESTIYL